MTFYMIVEYGKNGKTESIWTKKEAALKRLLEIGPGFTMEEFKTEKKIF